MTFLPENFTVGHQVYSATGSGYGNTPAESWSTPSTVSVYAIYPGTPGEDYEAGRNPSLIPMFLLGSKDALGAVKARDRFTVNGDLFEVDGAIEDFTQGPFGWTPGVRVRLMRVEG